METLDEYISRTKDFRKDKKLLISMIKPHGSVSKQTVGRWIKTVMRKAGLNDCFKPHSTRTASVSQAFSKGVPLLQIVHTAGWTNARTFTKFYNKPIADPT